MSPFISEIIGTMLLLLLGDGVVANVVLNKTKGNNGGWIVIATGWGLAVFLAVAVAGPYSGAHINPAVTLGLAFAGKFPWAKVPLYICAQMIGAMLGAGLVWLAYRDHFKVTKNLASILCTFSTMPEIHNKISNIITEAIGTFVLVFVVFYLSSNGVIKPDETPIGLGSIGALPVGLLVGGIGLSLGGPTGYAINPARDLGPRIMHAILPIKGKRGSGWSYAWVPVFGPIIGAGIAAILNYLVL